MVIITGLGRCGTSFLIRYLKECGVSIGKNVHWHDEVNAGYELSTFYSPVHDVYDRYCKVGKDINLNDECRGEYWKGKTYREVFDLVDKDDRQGEVKVVKDPRVTWHPDIISAINEARQGNIKVILCHRKVEDVIASRERLSARYGDPKPRKVIDEYHVDFSRFYTRLLEDNIIHRILFYPNFVDQFLHTWCMLESLGIHIEMRVAKEKWEKLAWNIHN